MSSYEEAFGSEGMLLAALKMQSASMPSVNPWEVAYSFLAEEAKRRGCHVILSGEGGNEWLEVDWLYSADLLRSADFAGLSFLWKSEHAYSSLPSRELARLLFWTSGARPLLRTPLHLLLQRAAPKAVHTSRLRQHSTWIPGWVAPDKAVRGEVVERWLRTKPQPQRGTLYARARRRRLDNPGQTVFKEARFERAGEVGVSLLDPFYDVDLVEFLLEMPPELLSLGGRAKGLAAGSLRRRVDSSSVDALRPVSLDAFLQSVMRVEGERALNELGGAPVLAELGIVDEPFLRSSIKEGQYGGSMNCYHAWTALASEAWLQRHLR
jgi:asparagine synthetase B (glutamine-hydrolysing)